MPEPLTELLVRTSNPAWLDQTLNQLGGVVGQHADGSYVQVEPEVYVVRAVSGTPGFLRFAITHQGYGEVVGERAIPPSPVEATGMPDPTPGQVAYAAYWPALGSAPPVAWDGLSPVVQHAWEAAAQAVLDHAAFPPLDLRLAEP